MTLEILGGVIATAGTIVAAIFLPDGDPVPRAIAERIVDDRSWRADMLRQAARDSHATASWRQVTGELTLHPDADWILPGEIAVMAALGRRLREERLIARVHRDLFVPVIIGRPPASALAAFERRYVSREHLAVAA